MTKARAMWGIIVGAATAMVGFHTTWNVSTMMVLSHVGGDDPVINWMPDGFLTFMGIKILVLGVLGSIGLAIGMFRHICWPRVAKG